MSPGRLKVTNKSMGKIKPSFSCRLGEDMLGVALSRDGSRTAFASYGKLAYYIGRKEKFRKDISKFSKLTLSANGEKLLLTTYDGCWLLDGNDEGNTLWEYEGEREADLAELSADGETILVACDRDLKVFDKSGRKMWDHSFYDRIWSLAVSESGDYVAVGTAKVIYYFHAGKLSWDFRTGKLVLKIRLTPDGKYCGFTSNRHVFLFNSNGLMEWSIPCEYCRELGISDDLNPVSVGLSTEMHSLTRKGIKIFEYKTGDFITRVEVAASGECIAVGSGSDIFRTPELICLDSKGKDIWRYRAHGRINDIAISETGRFVAFCDNRKGMVVDNRVLVKEAARRSIKDGEKLMGYLIDEELDVARGKQMLLEAAKQLGAGNHDDALREAKKACASFRRMKDSFEEAGERVPAWMKKLGYQPAGEGNIGPDLVRTVFPIYIIHKRLEESSTLKNIISRYQKRYNAYVGSKKSIDLEKLKAEHGEESAAVKEIEFRMMRSSIASLSINRLIGRLENLDYQRIQYIFGLENRARNIILDRIDGKDCRAKVRKAEEDAQKYLKGMESLMENISQQAQTIDNWIMSEMKESSEYGMEFSYDYTCKEKELRFILSIRNGSQVKLLKPVARMFTNLDEADIIAPATGMEPSPEPVEKSGKAEFGFLIRMNAVQGQGINGYLEFEDRDENVIRVKMDTFSPDILVPFIEPLVFSERQYTSTRSRGKGKTINRSLDIACGTLAQGCEKIIGSGGEMYVVRGIPANVKTMNSAIIWLSGELNSEKILAGFTLTRNTEPAGTFHIDMSVYSRNENYSHRFVVEFEKKLKSTDR